MNFILLYRRKQFSGLQFFYDIGRKGFYNDARDIEIFSLTIKFCSILVPFPMFAINIMPVKYLRIYWETRIYIRKIIYNKIYVLMVRIEQITMLPKENKIYISKRFFPLGVNQGVIEQNIKTPEIEGGK